ncbi:PREDICTED: exosome complex component rrp45 [Ceratosolen solmsi marchali]|uniref:Exosome complex component RRP45 n=1 Tax=Ceratosolen solmsi marchali TaxID=326594 RepID=A0AAJ7DZ96_9HYME|nr:PREDICTED: exosome complex component rrp45 [Ceratosolen solmsi marchali]
MKETYVSICERNFVNKAVSIDTRLDGRTLLEPRLLRINIGSNWGSCIVSLGQTKVAAQVSCDVRQPKTSRPNEGMLHINVEFSALAALHFDNTKQSEATSLINRQLEKCLKDSKCVDLESLCIVADKKVWNIRIDVNIINHDGNLIDCASIASLTALMHFHRPDVTSTGEEVIIHSFTEKDPLPLTLYHHPVCISFITFENGKTVVDPTHLEERVGSAILTLTVNSYQEICSLYFDYIEYTSLAADVIPLVTNFAANYASKLVKEIKEVVKQDIEAKYKKETPKSNTFSHCIAPDKIMSMISERINIKLLTWKICNEVAVDEQMVDDSDEEQGEIFNIGDGTADLITKNIDGVGEGGKNTWQSLDSSDNEFEQYKDIEYIEKKSSEKIIDDIELSGNSEEETTTVLSKEDLL